MTVIVTIYRAAIRFLREADMFLFLLSLASSIYGIILISSIVRNFDTGNNEVAVQLGAMVIGIVLFVLFSYIDIDIIADKSRFLFLFSILLISTLLIWGVGGDEVYGRRAWLRFFGIGIQPAEITKVPFIIIIARMIVNFKERKSINSIISIVQIFIVFAVMFVFVLIISEDMGTALVYFGILVIMLFAGGIKLRWFAIGAALLIALTPLIWDNFLSVKQRDRILAPFMPDVIDPNRTGVLWQPAQSVEAIATGGWTGQGIGNGRLTQSGGIPAQHTDFVFSAAGEELGFVGCLLIIALLVTIIVRCVNVGLKSNNPLGMLVCIGVAAMLITQMLENIGMSLGLMPVIGITLPFFSYGGSSLVTCFAAMGIVSGIKMRPKPARFRNL